MGEIGEKKDCFDATRRKLLKENTRRGIRGDHMRTTSFCITTSHVTELRHQQTIYAQELHNNIAVCINQIPTLASEDIRTPRETESTIPEH